MFKAIVTSDLHGNLPIVTEEFDLMLICGDVVPAHDHYFSFQKEWVENEFVEWILSLPFKNVWSKVVMTPGNHDIVFERWNENDYQRISMLTNGRLIILRNKEYRFDYIDDGSNMPSYLKIFGTPYCQIFGNWAFMRSDAKLKKKFAEIPEDLDVLITHSAPDIEGYGYIDWGTPYKRNAGCPILAAAIKEKQPQYVFCGHIHSGNHKLQVVDGTAIANVSYVDEAYEPRDNMLKLYLSGRIA